MNPNQLLDAFLQSFVFRKVLPSILIGIFAYQITTSEGGDFATFIAGAIVFWAAVGVGHGLAQVTTRVVDTDLER